MTVQELNKMFGINLRTYREKKGWTQVRLSVESGIPISTISQYETGRMFASARALIIICALLDIETWQLYVTEQDKKETLTDVTTQLIREQVSRNIRHYRMKKGLRQYEVAEKMGVTHTTVSNHEVCRFFPTLEEIAKYANILDIEVSQLFGETEKRKCLIKGAGNDKCA